MVASSSPLADKGVINKILKSLPKITKTGNFVLDSEAETKHDSLLYILETLLREPQHIAACETTLRKRMRAMQEAGPNDFSEVFQNLTTVRSIDETFRTNFVCSHSDFAAGDLVTALSYDIEATADILEYMLQLPKTFRLSDDCKVKAILNNLFTARCAELGNRGKDLRSSGALAASGRISWEKFGCYKLKFEGNICKHIIHVSGDFVDLMDGAYIDNGFTLAENYSDWSAYVQKKPMAPQRLHVFFAAAKNGPYRCSPWKAKKCPAFDAALPCAKQKYEMSRAATAAPEASATTVKALHDMKQAKQQAGLARARAAAAKTLAAKQRKRIVKLA